MNKIGVVMRREFLSTVKRKSYLIVTFGMPFFATIYIGLFAAVPLLHKAQKEKSDRVIGVIDRPGLIVPDEIDRQIADARGDKGEIEAITGGLDGTGAGGAMMSGILDEIVTPPEFRFFETNDLARAALEDEQIDRFYVIAEDYVVTGAIELYRTDDGAFGLGGSGGTRWFRKLLSRSMLSGRVSGDLRDRIERPISEEALSSFVLSPDGVFEPVDSIREIARWAIPAAFGMLLLMSLMTSGGYLLQGVLEEKENRVVEVILSSVRPDHLLFGKLLGLGAAGLLQLLIWVAVAGMATSIIAAAVLAYLDFKLFAACLIYFILGFLMIGSLMTGTGALGTSARESQQYAAIWSLAAVLPPAMTWMVVVDEPNGMVARVLSWFPLSAPITMMIRLGTHQVALWDFVVGVLCLALGVYLSIRISAGLFRLGILMYGSRPTIRQIFRQIRGS